MSWFLLSKTDLITGEATSAYRWDQEGETPIEIPEHAVTELINCLLSRLSEEEETSSLDTFAMGVPSPPEEPPDPPVEIRGEGDTGGREGKKTLRDLMRQSNNRGIEDEDGVSQG